MWIRIAVLLGAALVVSQLVRPELTSPPPFAELKAPSEVKRILRKSCFACHSDEVRLSWFDEIVPAYLLVVHDVKRARQVLNFSELGTQPAAHQNALLVESVSEIQMGAMPPLRYVRFHRGAQVTSSELAVLRDYLSSASSVAPVSLLEVQAADAQYREWIAAGARSFPISPAPNGIEFIPEYKQWQAISSTDRTDTNTLKMILANGVAVKAIEDHTINPWPNGTAFAKVSWRRQRDVAGIIRTGKFEQVAFMIKDSRKYASAAGWGWAQWTGPELKAYGTDAGFAQQCVACHRPLSGNDYVFTAPISVAGDAL